MIVRVALERQNGTGERLGQIPTGAGRLPTIEEQIEDAVTRAIERLLGPYLHKLVQPEPAVYTVSQVAMVLQVSDDTVSRLVKRGVLPRIPHLGGKVLVPRAAVERLLAESDDHPTASPARMRSISSAASRSDPGMKCR